MSLLKEMELGLCEPCGNYVPTVEIGGDVFCQYCYKAYPDLAEIIR